ncbi:MAG: hypothetical protein ACI9BD_001462, partial [Candidatus Marinamargulisbacteria bacterium]
MGQKNQRIERPEKSCQFCRRRIDQTPNPMQVGLTLESEDLFTKALQTADKLKDQFV